MEIILIRCLFLLVKSKGKTNQNIFLCFPLLVSLTHANEIDMKQIGFILASLSSIRLRGQRLYMIFIFTQ